MEKYKNKGFFVTVFNLSENQPRQDFLRYCHNETPYIHRNQSHERGQAAVQIFARQP